MDSQSQGMIRARQIKFALLVGLCLSAGCTTISLTPAGGKVRVTSNPEVVRECKYVGAVQGTDHMNGGMAGQGAAEEDAMREIRNKAAEIGANTVQLTTSMTGFSGSTLRGEGYSCM